jgi:hypothetical protein
MHTELIDRQKAAELLEIFAASAHLLTVTGIYGVLASRLDAYGRPAPRCVRCLSNERVVEGVSL